jgi:hypothetical protein
MPLQEVVQLLQAAIEASVYVAPTEPGLTASELSEVGKRLGFKEGEISDALPRIATKYFGKGHQRLLLADHFWHMPGYLIFAEEPDLRNPAAFDFVVTQLNELVREVGGANARLDRRVILDRAQAQSIDPNDCEYAPNLDPHHGVPPAR